MTLDRGSLLNNRYRVVEILGQGGMGSIYRAVDENLGMDVAVKENLFTTEEYARQFRREAVLLASLRHPNLPRVTDHFVIENQGQYLVMDFIEGEDLRERMDREGLLLDSEVVLLGAAICDALGYLHTRQPQVVHRDIKPGNVKITPAGHIILVDFGLAKVIQTGQATTTGARAMTPGYSPPEQYGTARTDERSDIYSLGATLYVALTGVLPEDALARAMGQVDLTPIRKHNPKVSKRLAAVIEKAMELRPDDRFKGAEEFKKALLNTRVITGGKPANEITLTPPPAGLPVIVGSNGELVSTVESNGVRSALFPNNFGSPLLPISTPLADQVSRPAIRSRRKRSAGCWVMVLFVVSLGILIIVGANAFRPDLIEQARNRVAPILSGIALPALPGMSTPASTPTSALPGVIEQATSTSTATPDLATEKMPSTLVSPGGVFSVTPTATQKPTATPGPTRTPTAILTPMGGGSGLIAYASAPGLRKPAQIWLMNADGSSPRQITEIPEGACQPAWAPDGTRLAFISPCTSNQETYPGASIWIINPDGTGLTALPTFPGGDFDPAWSPDGTQIAFTSLRDYKRAQVYVLNLADNSVKSLSANLANDSQPFWSPDGNQIVFVSPRASYRIWIMSSDGSNPTGFTRNYDLKDTHPVWSPDGQVILFTRSEQFGGIPRLVPVRVTGGILPGTPLVREIIPMREGSYSPDGSWIAYEGWPEGGNHDIFVMTSNGILRQRLTDDAAFDFDPAWQPMVRQP